MVGKGGTSGGPAADSHGSSANTDAIAALRLASEALRWTCPPIAPSRHPPRVSELLGQTRAMAALRLGLELYGPGYNIFVSGIMGTGRTTVVRHLLEEMKPACRLGPDRVYVNNLYEPNRPRLITLPRGSAQQFRRDMEDMVLRIHDGLQSALRSRPHKTSRRLVVKAAEEREHRLMAALTRESRRAGCALVQFPTQGGGTAADIYLLHDDEPVSVEALNALVHEKKVTTAQRTKMLAARDELMERLTEVSERARDVARRTERELRAMDRHVAARVLEMHFRDFRRQWPQAEVSDYLAGVRRHVERDLERWVALDEGPDAAPAPPPQGQGQGPGLDTADPGSARPTRLLDTKFRELAVHVVRAHDSEDCPVVVETNPTYANLFGTVEAPENGEHAGLAALTPGALVQADGGYLILRLADVLTEPGVWSLLKRALKSGKLEIRHYDASSGTTGGALQPEAIPLDVKVLLIGEPGHYEAMTAEDPQFSQTFKVHAEFDTTIPVGPANLRRYADFLHWMAEREGWVPLSNDANAAVAEYGARRSGRRDRLTTCFGDLADVGREASFLAKRDGAPATERLHVAAALRERESRHDLPREQVEREFRDGYLLLRTAGRDVGQVNALTVLETGTLAFGKPCRITAAAAPGTRGSNGVLNIEREIALSGPLHDKGVMILHGFLLEQFGSAGPICVQATLCFEQTYGGVEGDSASSAELYALLSALARVPLEQGLAITGSVNQKGEIQSVGSVNEKIEGFFRLCRMRKLTGRQGVLVPRANVADLMLDPEVVAAVAEGRFHVYGVEHVREGLELLTGLPAADVFDRVAKTLERFRRQAL